MFKIFREELLEKQEDSCACRCPGCRSQAGGEGRPLRLSTSMWYGLRRAIYSFQLCSFWIASLFCSPQAFIATFAESLITGGSLRPGNLICSSVYRATQPQQVVTCTKAMLWSRDPYLAEVANGHLGHWGNVIFPWWYSETPWITKLEKTGLPDFWQDGAYPVACVLFCFGT